MTNHDETTLDDDCIIVEAEGPSAKCHQTDVHPLLYEKPPPKYNEESILNILLNPKLDVNRVCTSWPLNVESSSTFVIDISKLTLDFPPHSI